MQVQVMASSRRLSANEVETFESRYGYRPMEIPIALEAVAVYVHKDNPIQASRLIKWPPSSRTNPTGLTEITTWGQLGFQDERREASLHVSVVTIDRVHAYILRSMFSWAVSSGLRFKKTGIGQPYSGRRTGSSWYRVQWNWLSDVVCPRASAGG